MRKEILQAILDDRQIMNKTDTGYIEVSNKFVLQVMANGGGEFFAVKPLVRPDLIIKGKLYFLGGQILFGTLKEDPNMIVTMDGTTNELKAVRLISDPAP